MKAILEYLVSNIVSQPQQVKISATANPNFPNTVVFNLKVASEDMGKVIGKEGKIIKALRTVMKIVGAGQKKNVAIQLAEDQ